MSKAAMELALEALEYPLNQSHENFNVDMAELLAHRAITAIEEALAQPEQEPLAMKFKIYKPTVPDPMRQGINNALLPWVYDQDRNSGFDATMWVTPVATLPPQRKPLSDEEIILIVAECASSHQHTDIHFARAIEAAHGIKEIPK